MIQVSCFRFHVSGFMIQVLATIPLAICLLLELVHNSDNVSERDECSRRKDEEEHTVVRRNTFKSEHRTVSKQLTADTKEGESDGETESDSYSVEGRVNNVVL